MAKNEREGYCGKISNGAGQVVNAVYPQTGGKSPQKQTGEDLRSKSSK